MQDIDWLNINNYTIDELIQFLNNGVSFDDMCKAGLLWDRRERLKTEVDRIAREIQEKEERKHKEDEFWQTCCSRNTIKSYEFYLDTYPGGKYEFDAQMRINELRRQFDALRQAVLDDMWNNPFKYSQDNMRMLYNGGGEGKPEFNVPTDPFKYFLYNGGTFTHAELQKEKVIPQDITMQDVLEPDYQLDQRRISDLGDYPTGRTDVFFLGVPGSGKSCVMAGLLYHLHRLGVDEYVPQIHNGKDLCQNYYYGLINSVGARKAPAGTADETISFMQLDIRRNERVNKITIVEMSGEAFRNIADVRTGNARAWEEIDATQILKSTNRKVLFFVLDYSLIKGDTRNEWNRARQNQALEMALTLFTSDGDPETNRGCTMSKVDTVAIIMTKSDLMEADTPDGRLDEAENYLNDQFRNFMNRLSRACGQYGINRNNNNYPFILTFSLGEFYPGNTFVFNPEDSNELANFIMSSTVARREGRGGIFR